MRITRVDFPNFSREQIRLQEAMKKLPKWVGSTALNFYKDSWRRQGYIDRSFTRWQKRKAKDRGRAILVKSGKLRRSLRMSVQGTTIQIYTDMPYAEAHNEGANITQVPTPRQRRFFWAMHAKAKKTKRTSEADMYRNMALAKTLHIKIPKRQFMDIPGGDLSNLLERRILTHITSMLRNALD